MSPSISALVLAAALSRVFLFGTGAETRVLVFDHQDLLDEYRSHHWHSVVDALTFGDRVNAHSFTVDPGTSAVIIAKRGDDIGIKVTDGLQRGNYGWIDASNVR